MFITQSLKHMNENLKHNMEMRVYVIKEQGSKVYEARTNSQPSS